MITLFQSIVLGIVEGVTEFLPVSSTGHLILASVWLGLHGEAVKSFEVVIQAGALGAILFLYRERVRRLPKTFVEADPENRVLLIKLIVSFLPSAIVGLAFHRLIKEKLFGVQPVIFALALGGVVMLWVDRKLRKRRSSGQGIESLGFRDALWIGLAQCLALWPGTSRSMVTIVAGLLLGLSPAAAAEYSFLLAIPTLGAATLFELMKGGTAFLHAAGGASVLCGFLTSAVVAAFAVRGFVRYLTTRGLAPFGWYRILFAISLAVWLS